MKECGRIGFDGFMGEVSAQIRREAPHRGVPLGWRLRRCTGENCGKVGVAADFGKVCREFHQCEAEGILVAGGGDGFARELLGRHILVRTAFSVGGFVGKAGQTEIAEFNGPFVRDEHVRWFHVPVDDAAVVGIVEGLGEGDAEGEHVCKGGEGVGFRRRARNAGEVTASRSPRSYPNDGSKRFADCAAGFSCLSFAVGECGDLEGTEYAIICPY